jgi:hypothetical protein
LRPRPLSGCVADLLVKRPRTAYLSIIEFQALKRALDDDWKRALDFNWDLRSVTSDEELAHLKEYIQQIKDTRFRQRLVAAVDEFYAHRAGDDNSFGRSRIVYETKVLAVSWVDRSPENGWGFHFKDTDEFGLYSFFLDDNNKEFQHLYRTDSKFEEEIYLDYLHIDDRL